jgi:predicted lipase
MDWNITFEMAALSLAVYDDSSEAVFEWYDKVLFFEDKHTSTEAYLVSGSGIRVIAIRGTDSKRDWFWNLALKAKRCPKGRHHGFNQSAKSILKSDEFSEFLTWDGPVLITGHSKGGAIGQIIAMKMKQKVDGVYGFGCPRVGNREFRKAYNAKHIPTYLWRNCIDPVTWLPPYLMGFVHVVKVRRTDRCGHSMGEYFEWAVNKAR